MKAVIKQIKKLSFKLRVIYKEQENYVKEQWPYLLGW